MILYLLLLLIRRAQNTRLNGLSLYIFVISDLAFSDVHALVISRDFSNAFPLFYRQDHVRLQGMHSEAFDDVIS